jgi:GTPase
MNAGLVDLFGDCDSSSDDSNEIDNFSNNSKQVLPPEVEFGNVEYKLKLIDPSEERFERLVTQMKWRLQEGLGEAIYEIGVEDNGYMSGLNEKEMAKSFETLELMAKRLGASVTKIRGCFIDNNKDEPKKETAEFLVRKVPEDSQFIDIRIAVCGNIEAGKSTLISVLTHGELDNGSGRARLNLFRHLHEIQTGHTSSINNEIMGFNDSGQVQNFSNCQSPEEICEKSSKIFTFIDLAGSFKYMKTTIFGLTGYAPDFVMLVINANNGIVGTTKEHLGFSLVLNVPVFIVINKTDSCTEESLKETLETIDFLLKSPGCGKIPLFIQSDDDVVLAAQNFVEPRICPIFTTSCVNGTNLDKLKKFFNVLPPLLHKKLSDTDILQQHAEFRVDEVFLKKKAGHILGGMLVKGTVQEHEKLLLGPFGENGQFLPVEVQTVQRYRVPCRLVRAGQSAALSIGNKHEFKEKIRKVN